MTSPPPSYPGGNYPGGNDFGNMPPYASGSGAPPSQRMSGLAIASLVLGIISIPAALTVWIGGICAILAIILGAIAMNAARKGRGVRRGLAMAGLITGLIGLILSIVVFVYAYKRTQACEHKIGHAPSRSELEQCIREGV